MKILLCLVLAVSLSSGIARADVSEAGLSAFNSTFAAQTNAECAMMKTIVELGSEKMLASEILMETMIRASHSCFLAVKQENSAGMQIPEFVLDSTCAAERQRYPHEYPSVRNWCR